MKSIDEEKISDRNEYLKEKYGIDGKNSITASLIGILKNNEDYEDKKDEYLREKYFMKNVDEKEIKLPSEEAVESKMAVMHLKDTADRDSKMKSEEFTDFVMRPFGDFSKI